MIGFGILAGLWPFHTWSPDGHVAAPTAVSMVHAGVLMKLGAFGIIRVGMTLLPEGAQVWMPLLIGLGAVNVIYGALSAMGQTDLKYVIGYSSVSHMGYVLMGLGTLSLVGLNGAVLQMFSHGVMTALFFAVVGMIYERTHTRDSLVLSGLAQKMGIIAVLFTLAGLTSLGLPGLSGFAAELLIFIGIFQSYEIWGIILGSLAVIGAAITAVYILRLLAKVFFGLADETLPEYLDSTPREKFAASILVIFIVLVGLWPFPFVKIIESGVEPILLQIVGAG
jgi:NADH-quinone oxidoreductase subunit M